MLKGLSLKILQKRLFILMLLLIFTSISSLLLSASDVNLELYKKWSFEKRSSILGILDLNADGLYEVLIDSPEDNSIICLSYTGEEIWRYPILENPSIVHGNLSTDICDEIVVASSIETPIYSTLISCLNYKGELLWEKTVDFDILEPLDIMDFDNDNKNEIVLIGDESVFTLDEEGLIKNLAEIGNDIIPILGHMYSRKLPLIIDYSNDRVYELLFKIDDSFLCYNLTGDLQWNYTIIEPGSEDRYLEIDPVAGDFNGNGEIEIFCLYIVEESKLEANKILQLNTSGGKILNKEIIYKFIREDVSALRDVNSDGIFDFVFTAKDEDIYCVSVNGSLVWSNEGYYEGGCCPKTDLFIFDLMEDNKTEIISNMFANSFGFIVLDSNGNLLRDDLYPENSWRIKALIDFDKDDINDFLMEEDGIVCCYGIETDKKKSTERGYEFNSLIHNYEYLDQDFDYLSDIHETINNCSITNLDTDNDNFLDGWEIQVGLNPLYDDRNIDSDNDGISNWDEIHEYHTSIFLEDTDGDGILDINDKVEVEPIREASFFLSAVILSSLLMALIISRIKKRKTEVKED